MAQSRGTQTNEEGQKEVRKMIEIRYSANQKDFKRYTTDEIRREFLIQNLFLPDECNRGLQPCGSDGYVGRDARGGDGAP